MKLSVKETLVILATLVVIAIISSCNSVKKYREKEYQVEQSSEASRVKKEMEERTRTVIDETLDTMLHIPQRAQKLINRPLTISPLNGLWTATFNLDSLNTTLLITVDSANHTIGVEATRAAEKIPAKKHRRIVVDNQKKGISDSTGKKENRKKQMSVAQAKVKKPDYSWIALLVVIVLTLFIVRLGILWFKSQFYR